MTRISHSGRTQEILALHQQGVPKRKIGRVLNIPQTCVWRILNKHVHIPVRKSQKVAPPAVTRPAVHDLPRSDGAVIAGHAVALRGLGHDFKRWRDLR
ncbi:hypothetical protein [Acetobacter sp.]|uniref:hypothetical protein n=1 Tax=Acetobacter sp. TaxID=440 RepID=UPI0039EB67F1